MDLEQITAYTAKDFRDWLAKNHDSQTKVQVIVYKRHTQKSSPSHRQLMEEAICYGWIDTTLKRIDDDRYIRNFSRRNKNSRWSNNTLGYAKELIQSGRMTEAGLHFYNEGRQKPTHDHGIPKNPEMPEQLKNALLKNKQKKAKFEKLAPSTKKMIYRQFLTAKRPETKIKRIKEILGKL